MALNDDAIFMKRGSEKGQCSLILQRFEATALIGGAAWGYYNPYVAGAAVANEFTKYYLPNAVHQGAKSQGKAIQNAKLLPLYRNFQQ